MTNTEKRVQALVDTLSESERLSSGDNHTAAQEGGQNRRWGWPEGNDLHHVFRFRNGEWQDGMRRGGLWSLVWGVLKCVFLRY